MRVEDIARVCHEANRAYARTLGDESHLPWDAAPAWQRASAIEGVQYALSGATAEELHDSWLRLKAADGWGYGPQKHEGLKTHPCFLPYDELPPQQQRKDALFRAVVTALR